MEKKKKSSVGRKDSQQTTTTSKRPPRKLTEYGLQLQEKQKVKHEYGVREKQFVRFFGLARRSQEATGEKLLSLLERRLDNVVYRLKLASTRPQARQLVVHGHVLVNGKRVHSPSCLLSVGDEVSLSPKALQDEGLLRQVVDKRLNTSIKVAEWLELDKKNKVGRVLRDPVRSDITLQVNENSIVELYSK